jgi:C-terminal processing protease CtpA/Prc
LGRYMTRFGICSVAALLLFAVVPGVESAETPTATSEFHEVYQLIRTHNAGISDAQLERAALHGLILSLTPQAQLITNRTSVPDEETVSKTAVFENNIGYVRVAHVTGGLPDQIRQAYRQFAATNRLSGLVMDVRYAGGQDYAAAAETADLFLAKAQPLLNWGQGDVSSHDKTNAIQVPLAILVNSGTSGSAEALAATLRSTGAGLVLGSRTAGHALITRDYPLKSGATLRLATGPVMLANGTPISTNGLKPDIDVTVDPDEERSYYADAFVLLPRYAQMARLPGTPTNQVAGVGTNGSRRARFGEAELVREHRAGLRDEEELPRVREPEPDKPLVNDPALARALDLLKGLAVVRQSRS